MQHDKKSKKNNTDKLRMLLDNNSEKSTHYKDEKYLKSLSKRLKISSHETIVHVKRASVDEREKEVDSLKPKVVIHARERKLEVTVELTKTEELPEFEEEKKGISLEEEDVFEVEKVEVTGPQFVQVEPKEIVKEKKEGKVDKKTETDEDLLEWVPVEPEELAEFKVVEEKVEPKEEVAPIVEEKPVSKEVFCTECGAELRETSKFCTKCGHKVEETEIKKEKEAEVKEEEVPSFIAVKEPEEKEEKVDKKTVADEGLLEWEPIEEVEKQVEDEPVPVENPGIEDEVKIETFKDIESIDDKTAVLLYDNGYTSVDALAIASVKDLAKIKGVKKKQAKKIKKEIEGTQEWEPLDVEEEANESVKVEPIVIGESAEGELTEEQIEAEEDIIKDEAKIETFKDLESIDDKTAIILYDSGFVSVNLLKEATVKKIAKVKAIKRKQAKTIKKELDEKLEENKEIISEDEDLGEYFVEEEEDEAKKLDDKIMDYTEPEPVEEELFEEETVEDVLPINEDEVEDNVFKDIPSINQKTAKILIENDITSIEILKDKTIKELTKIKGIKKKLAKQIKKELEEIAEETDSSMDESFDREDNPYIQEETDDEWVSFDGEKISDDDKEEIKGYKHGDYTLFEKEIETKSKKKRIVRFFSKGEPEGSNPIELPEGYEVKENQKTGLPYLKKK